MKMRDKIPGIDQIAPVFAVATVMIYGWTTYRFIEKLPSWLFYLTAQEILSNYSYTLVFDFAEALFFILVLVAVNFVLPREFFMNMFIARGSLLAFFGLGYLIYLALAVGQSKLSQFPSDIFRWSPLAALAILLMAVFLPRLDLIRKAVEDFADRAIIFLYIFLPLTALGILLFLYNNLL